MSAPSCLAHPAHLATFIKFECLSRVDRSWAMAARAMRGEADNDALILVLLLFSVGNDRDDAPGDSKSRMSGKVKETSKWWRLSMDEYEI